MNQLLEEKYKELGISEKVYAFGEKIEQELKERFEKIDANAEYNQMKVIAAMQKNRVSAECFNISSGYGYNDMGRDTLERVYADCFGGEDALVRPQITCGTHALALALMSNLRPGDELLSPVGKPYDTLEEVIGIRPSKGSLAEYGITYSQVDLLPDGSFDYDGIRNAIHENTRLVTIQRSKGYQTRPTLSVERIGELITFIKNIKPDVICMVDNCYGEFVEDQIHLGLPDSKPGWRSCPDWRIHCREKGMCGKCGISPDFPWTRKRSRSFAWCDPVLLSGTLSCTDRCKRCLKGSHFCGRYL